MYWMYNAFGYRLRFQRPQSGLLLANAASCLPCAFRSHRRARRPGQVERRSGMRTTDTPCPIAF